MSDVATTSPAAAPPESTGSEQSARAEVPASLAETATVLRDSSGSVLVRGGATKLDWAGRVDQPDLVLDTAGLRGVLTHNAADLTASVRAGTPLAELQEALAGDQQWLALDPATEPVGATVGGLLAAGDSGPSRLRYGGLRDLVIGVTLVLADGTVARSGGHVIKNVAGYDLAKLVYGSLGSLAVIAEVVIRLHPRLTGSVTVAGVADATQAGAAGLALMASPLEPTAVEWIGDPGSPGQLLVRTDGTPDFVAAGGQRVVELLATVGVDAEPLSPDAARQEWSTHAEAVRGGPKETLLRLSARPGDVTGLLEAARRHAEHAGSRLRVVSSVALGLCTLALTGGDPQGQAELVTALRAQAASGRASVLVRSRPDTVEAQLDALGPPPSTTAVLRRIKSQFDPGGRLAPGRFRPWY